jgi:predicted RNase H-like HicB family nuclease
VSYDEDALFESSNEPMTMPLTLEVEREDDGRWLAEVMELSGVLAYGQSRQEAVARAQALALRVIADRLDHGEEVPVWVGGK